jgi:hypothetical protein
MLSSASQASGNNPFSCPHPGEVYFHDDMLGLRSKMLPLGCMGKSEIYFFKSIMDLAS